MKKLNIILLRGKAQAGKSTVAQYLESQRGYYTFSFAGPIHRHICDILDLPFEEVPGKLKNTPLEALGGKTPRQAMQTLGTEWGRNMIFQKIWTTSVIDRIKKRATTGQIDFVISDFRFDNEYNDLVEAFGEENVKSIHVIREDDHSGMEANEKAHVSENGISVKPTLEVTVKNFGDFTELHASVEEALFQLSQESFKFARENLARQAIRVTKTLYEAKTREELMLELYQVEKLGAPMIELYEERMQALLK